MYIGSPGPAQIGPKAVQVSGGLAVPSGCGSETEKALPQMAVGLLVYCTICTFKVAGSGRGSPMSESYTTTVMNPMMR